MQQTTTKKTRLFSPDSLAADSEVWLSGEQTKYVTRVLRLNIEDTLIVFDGNGGQYRAVIKELAKDRALLHVGEHFAADIESPLPIHLVQGISRSGRMDVVIQKSTELGVRRITPAITEFSVVKLDDDRAASRHEHWRKISQSACEQCGRNTLPEIEPPQKLAHWLNEYKSATTTRIMLDPQSGVSISQLAEPKNGVVLLIGPEGGLSDGERAQCVESGFRPVTLGPRILRTETAAVAGIAVLQTLWGDFGQVYA